jgi:hypothetical protein
MKECKWGKNTRGESWYVRSDKPVEVKVCGTCRNPVVILNPDPVQEVKTVTFNIGTAPVKKITVGELPLQAIREHLAKNGERCPWCGCLNKWAEGV